MTTVIDTTDPGTNNITFVLNQIDVHETLTALEVATVNDGSAVSLTGDVIMETGMSVSDLQTIFKFQTDQTSIDDITSTDILFQQDFTATLSGDSLLTKIVSSETEYEHVNTGMSTGISVGQEYVQYIAYNVFGTRKGADIISNESTVRSAVQTHLLNAFTAYFNTHNVPNGSSIATDEVVKDKICQHILETIMRQRPQRLQVGSGAESVMSDVATMQGIPFATGDVLFMKFALNDTQTHCADLVSTAFTSSGRSYLIKITVN